VSTDSDSAAAARHAPTGYRFAGAWIRFFALLIDNLITIFPLMLLLLGGAVMIGGGGFVTAERLLDPAQSGWVTGAIVYVATSVALIIWMAAWQANIGASPGMLLLKLRVRGPNAEDHPSVAAAATRNAVPILSNLGTISANTDIDMALQIVGVVVFIAIGISISNSPTRQGFHDRLAGGTYVLQRVRDTGASAHHDIV
jgi:RDD family